jgi:hypothetical protein
MTISFTGDGLRGLDLRWSRQLGDPVLAAEFLEAERSLMARFPRARRRPFLFKAGPSCVDLALPV